MTSLYCSFLLPPCLTASSSWFFCYLIKTLRSCSYSLLCHSYVAYGTFMSLLCCSYVTLMFGAHFPAVPSPYCAIISSLLCCSYAAYATFMLPLPLLCHSYVTLMPLLCHLCHSCVTLMSLLCHFYVGSAALVSILYRSCAIFMLPLLLLRRS